MSLEEKPVEINQLLLPSTMVILSSARCHISRYPAISTFKYQEGNMQNGFFNDASMDVFVVVVWSHVPDLKMLSLAPVFVRRGRLATAHRCIWKIGQCGSMERWPGPQHVGWKLRKHNSWDDLDNNTKRPGAWTISALDTSQCCPLWGVFCSQNIVFSFQCRQRLGKILKTRCICF